MSHKEISQNSKAKKEETCREETHEINQQAAETIITLWQKREGCIPTEEGEHWAQGASAESVDCDRAEKVKWRISDNEAMKTDRQRLEYAVITVGLVFLALRNGLLRLRTAWNLEKGWV